HLEVRIALEPADLHARRPGAARAGEPAQARSARRDAPPGSLTVSTAAEVKRDGREWGAAPRTPGRSLTSPLQAFGGCTDAKPLVRALEASRMEAVLYQDVNDPRGVGVLGMSEDPTFLVGPFRELLNGAAFGELILKPELTMLGRTYASGFEADLD